MSVELISIERVCVCVCVGGERNINGQFFIDVISII